MGRDDGALVVRKYFLDDRDGRDGRERVTVSVRVDDGTPVNVATVAVTLLFTTPLAFPKASVEYVVSPFRWESVHTLMAMGGVGDYRYEKVAGDAVLKVNAAGVVLLTGALPAGRQATAVFAVTDEIGGSVRLSLRVVSSRGYGEAMYAVDSYDVWRSVDGLVWTKVSRRQYPWDDHRVVSHRGQMVLMEEHYDGGRKNRVWASWDGVNWWVANDGRAISGGQRRRGYQLVSHGGSLWFVGGVEDNYDAHYRRDIWRSEWGSSWVYANNPLIFDGGRKRIFISESSRFPSRTSHQVVSHHGYMWLVGGGG